MKILHINSYYASSFFYKNLYEEQVKQGEDIKVYVPVPQEMPLSGLSLGDYTDIVPCYRKHNRALFHVKHKKIWNDLKERYKESKFDIIHAHSLFSNGYLALLFKQLNSVPYIVAVRNTDVNIFFKYMVHLRKLGIEILDQASKIIFLSEVYQEKVLTEYIPKEKREKIKQKCVVIPNGVNEFWLNNRYKRDYSDKDNNKLIHIITVGLVCKNKNQITVCKAIEHLRRKGFLVDYTIIGKVSDERLKSRLMRYSFVRYIPFLPKENLIEYYRKADVFAMPSLKETFGLTYVEAMSQGLPVIYSMGQGFDGQFDEGCVGYHVEAKNWLQIAEKIVCIKDDYADMSKRCFTLALKFNWKQISDEYEFIYKNITRNWCKDEL